MASSNLKSIIIKQDNNISETINPAAFSLLYQAIKEVVDYWSDLAITEQEKNQYKAKYNIENFIDISGAISVTYCYSNEYSSICKWVNGSSLNHFNPLSITITTGFYLSFADPILKEVMENVFYKNKLSGIINTSQIDDNKGITTTDISAYNFVQQKYEPSETDKIDYLFGVNKETFTQERCIKNSTTEEAIANSKKEKANKLDYFLVPNEENRLADIQILDLTPLAKIQERGWGVPQIITVDNVYGPICQKRMQEFWYYCPQKTGRGIAPSSFCLYTDDPNGRAIFVDGDGFVSEFQKMFFKLGYVDEGNVGHGLWPYGATYTQQFVCKYLVLDVWRFAGAILSQGIKATYIILVDSLALSPVVTPSNYTEEEAKEYFQNAVENGIFTEWNYWRNNSPTNFGSYVTSSGVIGGEGDIAKMVVPDDRYYYYIFSPYVKDALTSPSYSILFDYKTVNNVQQTIDQRITALKRKYVKYSDFLLTNGNEMYNSEEQKWWWQCNSSLNNIINENYPEDNTYNIYDL